MAPSFESERLRFRGHTIDDFAECAAMWAEPAVVRFIGGVPFTKEEVWTRLLRYIGHWSALGFGYWVIHEKASGRFAGEVGFAEYQRAVEPPLDGAPEAGWVLAPWAHGRGLATEAVQAIVAWGEAQWGARRTTCLINPEHSASIRVAEKCGYREFVRSTYKGHPTILFER